MSNPDQSALHFKVVTCGDLNVGKTSVIIRATYDTYTDCALPNAIDPDRFSLSLDDFEQPVVLDIFDTARRAYGELTTTFFRKADAALVFYSVDDSQSFENVNKWVEKVHESFASGDIQPILYIVENKNDLRNDDDESLLTITAGEDKAQELNAKFESVSAKTGDNVSNLFLKVGTDCLQKPVANTPPPPPIKDDEQGCRC